MHRNGTAILQDTTTYDHCLISFCIKKLCPSPANKKTEPGFTISKHIAEMKNELELVNNEDILELSYAYLQAMEQSIHGADFRYVIIHRENVPVFFAYFQLSVLTSQNFKLQKDKSFVKGIFRLFLDLKKVKVLISGNAMRSEMPSYCFNEDTLTKDEATQLLTSAAEKIAADENVTAVILEDIPVSARSKKWLSAMGYEMPWEDTIMTMNIERGWDTLADYVAALTRKYKTRANKIIVAGKTLEVRQLHDDMVLAHEGKLNRLFRQVADSQPFVLALPGADHFRRLKKLYKDNFEVVGFFLDNVPVAFYTAFITDDAYDLYYVGFDYELNGAYNLYFNILLSGLERAIVLKKKQLKLGRTSFDAKASLGAKPSGTSYFIKTAHLPNLAVKWFINYFSAMEDAKWKLRNPLR